ncbi:UPF0182 family protein [Desulfosporosinus sp. BICA1-9]|uniref:UPF0182 family membrane protein n=1 Tax=Desulfosporosinus sp. BICA1-9 TaxID=1531958 RepID=UPI00054B532C|nr:UPF0182 family protein [Desulfosporosinus sp. BICA1-9]KJS48160.1 MAG: hypothetical protein VR66_15730 [Peptococcaceae bacterium BRH_c23]KJS83192.1 MAG: hypothetical protein JL57_23120 [Desulfosporosinus sp. BICA1-9]HBW34717.1 UPF0182 family protein [Desulfosporosinus sp.]
MHRFYKLFVAIIILFSVLVASSGLFEDWLWFKDLGYTQLFWTPILSKALFQAVNGTILFIFIAGTLLSIRHAIVTFINERLRLRLRLVQDMNRPAFNLSQRRVTVWLLIISAVISFGISFVLGFKGWLDVLSFTHATQFNQVDPIFGKDLAFYFFQLPFLQTLFNAFFGPLFLLTFFTTIFYIITGVIRFRTRRIWQRGAVTVGSDPRRHLALLIGILLGLKAFGYYLEIFQLLYSVHGHVVGAGFSDLYATLPALKLLIVLSLLGSILAFFALKSNDSRLLTVPVSGIFVVGILMNSIFPALVQQFLVLPNELRKEQPYIQHEVQLTRFGYGLDQIQDIEYPGNSPITLDVLKAEHATLNNIRLNDARPMLQTYNQKQGIRLYYKFNDIDIDRYTVNGEYRQVMMGPREISTPDLDPKAKTFVNERFKYTHGFGASASFANAVTTEGLPSFAIKDVPPVSEFAEFKMTEPRIYYGELTNDWVVANTSVKEFDYPLGNSNAENSYKGKTGLQLTAINKLMLSLRHGTPRFYLASEVTSASKLLVYRNIMERVEKLAPFLTYDLDPYMVIDNGRIKWIIDAYTTSDALPYSNRYPNQGFNYIRNSVKVIIDAYDGTVDFYALDSQDPILKTYMKIFPGVFKDFSSLPKNLIAHLRYPETLFSVQSNMLKTFHMTNTSVFYNKEDAWDIAKELFEAKPQNVAPYYTIMKIPGEDKPEFVLMLPFTPASSATNTRNNMIAWMAARMDGEHYGELLLYKLPKNIEIDGPLQIESRIDQDTEISKQLSLWDQKGSSVIRGNLLALPIGGNFLYVEPIYLQSDKGGSIPEMKRVVLAYQDRLVMTENIGSALTQLFGEGAPQPTTPGQSIPTPAESPQTPITEVDEPNLVSIIDQMNQIRTLLDSLEIQLKGLQSTPSETPPNE